LQLQEQVFDLTGQRDAQARTLDAMAALWPSGSAPKFQASIALTRSLLADRNSDFPTAVKYAQEAARLAEQAEEWGDAARAYGEWAYVLTNEGEYEKARDLAARALAHARRSGKPLAEAQMIAVMASIEQNDRQVHRAITLTEQAIALAKTHGHSRLAG